MFAGRIPIILLARTRESAVDSHRASDYREHTVKILVIGSGGREHALIWRLRQSPEVEKIWCAPGNGGIADAGTRESAAETMVECVPVNADDVDALVALAERLKPDLTVVGPEVPLVAGIRDKFECRKMRLVGPSREDARLEGSKIFAKEFMERYDIPTPTLYGTFESAGGGNSGARRRGLARCGEGGWVVRGQRRPGC